jgi:hypothetical protein
MQPQWQPIETAPKDGTVILINNPNKYGPNKKPYKYQVLMAWYYTRKYEQGTIEYWDTFNNCHPKPTHWMPLPEPPK